MLNEFLRAYIVCALWSSNDDHGDPLDDNYDLDDLGAETLEVMRKDCETFQINNSELLAQAGDLSQNGHDFWLTRNGHGVGFWDRGYPDQVGDTLSKATKVFGECWLYVGDNGKLYIN